MVTLPLRGVGPLASTRKVNVPSPLWGDPPSTMPIQRTWLAPDQEQSACAVTETVTGPPVGSTETLAGLTENLQGAPAWVTSIRWSLIEIVARRGVATELALTAYVIVDSPCPPCGLNPIQSTSDLAVHWHSRLRETVIWPSTASASTPTDRVDSDTEQTDDGVTTVTTLVAESAPHALATQAIATTASGRTQSVRM
jgi:hypothetical protein